MGVDRRHGGSRKQQYSTAQNQTNYYTQQTTHNITVDKDENFEDSGFIFNVPKPKKAQGAQTPPPAQGQEQPQAQPAQEEVEKMNLMEFLEFLKIDFDKRYPDNNNAKIYRSL